MHEDLSRILEGLIRDEGLSATGIARAAGLPARSLRQAGQPGWRPDPDTIAKLRTYLDRRAEGTALASPEEIINEARNGRMFILVDDEDRENEGDLVIPAQMATPDAINFMARYGRGLICLAMTRARVERLGLGMMSSDNGTRHGTAFTTSIEARRDVETGISARDRARTISVAIDAACGPEDIVTPGHIFPLQARDGGVLVRAGHTEAAVDVARLAGLNPAGVICEILKEDGSMARLDDLIHFARQHGLRIGTIRDLIAYRLRHDHLIEKNSEVVFRSEWGGEWKAMTYFDRATRTEQIALQKGRIDPDKPTLVRMHQFAPLADAFGAETIRNSMIARAMKIIGEEGSGVIVVLNPPPENGLSRMFKIFSGSIPREAALRDYGVGAQILAHLGVGDMILLTNQHYSLVALDGYDLDLVGERSLGG